MRAVRGRQLFDEGVILEETGARDESEEEYNLLPEYDRETVISALSLSKWATDLQALNDQIHENSAPLPESETAPAFHGIFEGLGVLPLIDDGGVCKKIVTPGYGKEVSDISVVSYWYSGYTESEDEPFATNRVNRFPTRYRIGMLASASVPCEGVQIGLRSMKAGEISVLLVSPEYGYGFVGVDKVGMKVPKNSWLLFKVEVVSVQDASACDDLLMMATAEERHNLPFSQLLKATDDEKIRGTQAYHRTEYGLAKFCYQRAFRLMQEAIPRSTVEEEQLTDMSLKLLCNLAQTCLKLKRETLACHYADEALELNKNYFKAFKIKSTALVNLGEYKSAEIYISKALKLCPTDLEKRKLEAEQARMIKERDQTRKEIRDLNKAMAKAVLGPSFENVAKEFKEFIREDLEGVMKTKQPVTYELNDLSAEEVSFIRYEAKDRKLTTSEVEAEIGRKILIVQFVIKT